MSLDGFFAVLAVLVGLYALAQPIQQKSIWIFFPKWLFFSLLVVSGGVLLWTTGMEVYEYECKYDICTFILTILPFLIPVSALTIVIVKWNNARITTKRENAFINFIKTSRNENRYDELFRILSKNKDVNVFSEETIEALFEYEIVAGINFYPEWISLLLASKIENLSEKKYSLFLLPNLIRDIINKENSIFKKEVASKAGGLEHLIFTEYEQKLLDKTISNPHWYINNRVDYDLLFVALEEIDSGELDISYNSNNNVYMNRQGQNTRISCPLFLFIEFHSTMIEKAISADMFNEDYYVTDLYDVFERILKRFKYDDNVWSSPFANIEAPTPYFYLLHLILKKLDSLVNKAYEHLDSVDNEMLERLINVWLMNIKLLVNTENEMSESFITESLSDYLYFVLKVFDDKKETAEIKQWEKLLIKDILLWSGREELFSKYIVKSIDKLDVYKTLVLYNVDYLKHLLHYQ